MRVSALVLLLSVPAFAYPIEPQTLWDLTAASELIVLARVAVPRTHVQAKGDEGFDHDLARLDVLEVWKGKPEKEVSVAYVAGMICPAPPQFLKDQRVVAFLSQYKGQWMVSGLSYGTRYPADAVEEAATKDVVKRAMALQKPGVARRAPAEWALAAVAHRETRWDGLYALSAASDEDLSHYDRNAGPPRKLDDEDLAELERIAIATPSYDRSLGQFLRLLKGRASPALDRAFADAIESVLRGSSAPYWMDDVLDQFEGRLGTPPPTPSAKDPLAAEIERAQSRSKDTPVQREERVQVRWDQLKKKHRLTPVERPDFMRERRLPVGGSTPL